LSANTQRANNSADASQQQEVYPFSDISTDECGALGLGIALDMTASLSTPAPIVAQVDVGKVFSNESVYLRKTFI